MRITKLCVLGLALAVLWVGVAPALAQESMLVTPQRVDCIKRHEFWKVTSMFQPAPVKGKMFFRADITPPGEWYYVDMAEIETMWTGIGPKIGDGVENVTIHVNGEGPEGSGTSVDQVARVVDKEIECDKGAIAPLSATGPAAVFSQSGGLIGFGAMGTTVSTVAGGAAVGAAGVTAAGAGGLLGLGTAATVGVVGAAAAVTATTIAVTKEDKKAPATTIPQGSPRR